MLFSTQTFLLLFLPLTLAAYYAVADSRRARVALITLASFLFYAWWDPRFVPLLAGLIGLNWLIVRAHAGHARAFVLMLGVGVNLVFLALFKYANFLAENLLAVVGIEHEPWGLILPLGISFFTFQQISYLVDRYRGEAPVYGLLDYAAYVSFFPQLIAGPIVRHNELIAQFEPDPRTTANLELAARGLALFALGLTKKVFFADELAPIADSGFDVAAAGGALAFGDSWLSSVAYTLQLYFDFSAYSDTAIGLGALFGLRLPLNFDAPYRALDIRAFWRRWHMTLSRFLRDYVYIPLGGNRGSVARTVFTVMATMLLCGLWHGAGWTFIAWGALHGAAICVNRAWQTAGGRLPGPAAWALTMLFVIAGWVLFRADDFAAAALMLRTLAGAAGFAAGDGDTGDWAIVAIAAAFALLGPTAFAAAARATLVQRRYAVAVGCILFLITLRVGQGRGLEFIYFQF